VGHVTLPRALDAHAVRRPDSILRVRRRGPAVLLNAKTDLDAPTFQDLALISHEKGRHQKNLKAQNQRLKNQVCLQGASADARIPCAVA
jgi:hypothetical protein